jgi:hypothetical protein
MHVSSCNGPTSRRRNDGRPRRRACLLTRARFAQLPACGGRSSLAPRERFVDKPSCGGSRRLRRSTVSTSSEKLQSNPLPDTFVSSLYPLTSYATIITRGKQISRHVSMCFAYLDQLLIAIRNALYTMPFPRMRIALVIMSLPVILQALSIKAASAKLPRIIDLSQDNSDITILGSRSNDLMGYRFAIGDINGDGFLDLAIYSALASPMDRPYAGELSIFWGGIELDSVIDMRNYQGRVSRVFGAIGDYGLFASLECGDLNNDGYSDIILGIPLSYPLFAGDGKTYIIFGAGAFPDTTSLENSTDGFTTIFGILGTKGWLGMASCIADINGDNYDDLILSAPAYGEVYILYGQAIFPRFVDLADYSENISRIIDSDYDWGTGTSLAARDIDRDGFADILIGSPGNTEQYYQGKVTLIYGSNEFPDVVYLPTDLNSGIRVKHFHAADPHGHLGFRVSLGDINGDHIFDAAISAFGASSLGQYENGQVYVIYSINTLPDSIALESSAIPKTLLFGEGQSAQYGTNMKCIDLTSDGMDDIIVTSKPNPHNENDVFKVTIVYGARCLPDSIHPASDSMVTTIYGEAHGDFLGYGLGMGDINNDGLCDLLVGAYFSSFLGREYAGKSYTFLGKGGCVNTHMPKAHLYQNYPNPFSNSTMIEYDLPSESNPHLSIYDVLGECVARLDIEEQCKGRNYIIWSGLDRNGHKLPSGVYFYRLEGIGVLGARKLVILR